MKLALALGFCLITAVPLHAQNTGALEFISADSTLPFSSAVRAGNTIYLSGQIGVDDNLKLVSGGIGPETRQAMTRLQTTLESMGSSMNDVVKCTVFMADMKEWAAMNAEYIKFFPLHPPARSAVEVGALALGARMEVECVAVQQGTGNRE